VGADQDGQAELKKVTSMRSGISRFRLLALPSRECVVSYLTCFSPSFETVSLAGSDALGDCYEMLCRRGLRCRNVGVSDRSSSQRQSIARYVWLFAKSYNAKVY
jgi:hypothetical protein